MRKAALVLALLVLLTITVVAAYAAFHPSLTLTCTSHGGGGHEPLHIIINGQRLVCK